ncbi:uncharacterized protein MONOS_15593 [Monocercomonoides exilis]|uniref:uncharacterized protein n=1 Tax=Monocercomonoides exilis TaxID=2049356 RepID=UPI00355A979A|nr:hypothetical protein MONOS_15593 [Monocercomonoides exilis]|eukprot:MONOS_15593.1-p1 / transcript=MONOS_15593.1 / gene=MONOS_15593 / organism=Monocercomonoides_exilis_PA203 / gene_product=unspecified product / transcript_product=unspecified product / location=Mono_scaffold01281:8507-9043(-) / protein_length=179 / sequence_SO=supercontig / SO=protein_coding / is_pseudo=false
MEEEAKIRWMKEKTGLSTIKCAQAFFNLKASKQSLKEWVANNSQRDNEASSSDKPSTAPTSDQSEDFESTPQTQPQTQHKTQSQSQSQSQPQTLTSISTIHNTSQKEAPKQPAQIRNECLKITIKDELKIREIKKETDTSLSLATQYYLQNDRNKDKAIESIMKKKDEPTKYVLSDNT